MDHLAAGNIVIFTLFIDNTNFILEFFSLRSQISAKMLNRSTRQCRERYNNHLAPIIKKGNWTKEEDALIVKLQIELGNQWSKIAQQLPGRSDNSVKNRWHLIHRCRPADVTANDGQFLPISFNPKQVIQGNNPNCVSAPQNMKIEDIFIKPSSKSSFAAAFGFSSFSSDATDTFASASSSGEANGEKSTFSMTNIYRKNMLSGEKREKVLKPKPQEQPKNSFKSFIPVARSVSSSRTGSLQSLNDAADADTVDLMLLYHNHAEHGHEPYSENGSNEFEFPFPFSTIRPSSEYDRQSTRPSISSQGTHLRIDSFGFPEWNDDDLAPPADFDDPNFFNACDQGVLSTSNFPDFVRNESGEPKDGAPVQADNEWIDAFMKAEVEETISKQLSSTSFTNGKTVNSILRKPNPRPPFHSNEPSNIKVEDGSVTSTSGEMNIWDNMNYNFDMGKTPADLLLAYDERNQMIRSRSTARKSSMSGCKRHEGHSPGTSISDKIHLNKKHRMTSKVYVLAPLPLDSIAAVNASSAAAAATFPQIVMVNPGASTSSSSTTVGRSASSENSN